MLPFWPQSPPDSKSWLQAAAKRSWMSSSQAPTEIQLWLTTWLEVHWQNTTVKSIVSERTMMVQDIKPLGGLSSASISFSGIISHNEWSYPEVQLLQLWGRRQAWPSIRRVGWAIGEKEAAHPTWPAPTDPEQCRPGGEQAQKNHIPWWRLQVINVAAPYIPKPHILIAMLCITAVLSAHPVWMDKHTWHKNY